MGQRRHWSIRLTVSTLAILDLSNLIDRLTVRSRKVKGGGFQAESAIPQVAIFIYVRFGTHGTSPAKKHDVQQLVIGWDLS